MYKTDTNIVLDLAQNSPPKAKIPTPTIIIVEKNKTY